MEGVTSLDTIADLKNQPGNISNVVMVLGYLAKGDNKAKHFYFDSTSTLTEDLISLNVIAPITGGGRWLAVINKGIQVTSDMYMKVEGNFKTLYVSGITTIADTTGLRYLTNNGTSSGDALFTKILYENCIPDVNASSRKEIITANRASISVDLKSISYYLSRPNPDTALNLTVLGGTGMTMEGNRTVPIGTKYLIKVEGF